MQVVFQPLGSEILGSEKATYAEGFVDPVRPLSNVLRRASARFEGTLLIFEVPLQNPLPVFAIPIHDPCLLILDFLE